MLLLFSIRELNDHLFGKELFIWFTVCVFRKRFQFLCVFFFPVWLLGWDMGFDCINSRPLPFYLLFTFCATATLRLKPRPQVTRVIVETIFYSHKLHLNSNCTSNMQMGFREEPTDLFKSVSQYANIIESLYG